MQNYGVGPSVAWRPYRSVRLRKAPENIAYCETSKNGGEGSVGTPTNILLPVIEELWKTVCPNKLEEEGWFYGLAKEGKRA